MNVPLECKYFLHDACCKDSPSTAGKMLKLVCTHATKNGMQLEIQKQYFYLESQSHHSSARFLEPTFTDNCFLKQMCDAVNPCKNIRKKINKDNIS